MNIQPHFEVTHGYLVARFNGAKTKEEAMRHFELLAEECKRTNKNKLLLDFTGVPADFSLAEIYSLGVLTQVFAQHKCKVAAVCKPENHGSNCFLETVAQNRWVDLRTFTDVQSAMEWLLTDCAT
jgi:hypothetical protein